MNNLKTVIGIEIHTALNTKTKMFSSTPNVYNDLPNTNVNELDVAYPGALPQLNKGAVIRAIKLAKALNMDINNELHFDRKHYFYPDLPKGFQITQKNKPIGTNGKVIIQINKKKTITLERIQLEEDTAKSIHKGLHTLLDYNRAGVPLIEIVSNPDISNSKEAIAYVSKIRDILLALQISNAKMEDGSLRVDINISLMSKWAKELGTKVEIKNMNSMANIEKAIEFEIKLQTKMFLKGQKIQQATKRFDEKTQETVLMRVKTNDIDYKYFPETNIPIIALSKEFIDSINIPEMPWEMKQRYEKYGISNEFIQKLLSNIARASFFDLIKYKNKAKLAKIFFAEIIPLANKLNKSLEDLNIDPKEIQIAIQKVDNGDISSKHLKTIIPQLINKATNVNSIIEKNNMKQISDKKIINEIINTIINTNKSFINKNLGRSKRVHKFILGQVMKKSKGQVNPIIASKLVEKAVEK